jgi:tetratricopeptide (TPR) repeat protein
MTCLPTRKGQAGEVPAIHFAGTLLFLFLAACSPATTDPEGGTRWRPVAADTVVLTLEAGRSESLAAMRRELQEAPADSGLAARFAGIALTRYASNGDPRLLGYAAGALAYWQNEPEPPRAVWLLRGRLLQTQHHFREAAADLDTYLQHWPRDIEALILSADAWRRAGQIDAARSRCLALQLAGRADLARLCAADVFLALGDAGRALQAADAALAMAGDDSALAFAWSIRADAAFAAGTPAIATEAYRRAIAASANVPLALQLSYADSLLAIGDSEKASELLSLLPPADAVLLRRAIASKHRNSPDLAGLRAQLEARFCATDTLAVDELHWRERALYALDVQEEPALALQFAIRNWTEQKGWEDAGLLLRAAAAAGDPAAGAAVDRWREAQAGEIS